MSLTDTAQWFERALPHAEKPYTSRLWGHKFHSLCSYQGKLKPALAHWLLREFTTEKDIVLDPLGGVGTIPFEANQLRRVGWSNDKSPFASTIASAKLSPPTYQEALEALETLEKYIATNLPTHAELKSAEFGLNASVKDYFHPETLNEILVAKRWARDISSRSEVFVAANLLHILHGNRPYALSRKSHPITPFSPTGEMEKKSVSGKIKERLMRLEPHWDSLVPSSSISVRGDFRDLTSKLPSECDAIITSPPFPGMRFDRPNWMRMWFCGWAEQDFHIQSRAFLERQQAKSFAVYREFFSMAASMLRPRTPLLLHVGGSKAYDMVEKLKAEADDNFEHKHTIDEDVSHVEKHGVPDKGLTSRHLVMVLARRA